MLKMESDLESEFQFGFISSGIGIECAIPILNPHVLNR